MAETPDPTTTLAAWRAVTEGASEATRGLPWVVDPDDPRYVLASKDGGYDGMLVAETHAIGRDPRADRTAGEANATFIATFDPPTVGRLLAFAEAVLALHRHIPIYEECVSDRATTLCGRGDHLELGGGEWVHESEVLFEACETCRDDDGGWVEWPCPTAAALAEQLGGEGQ